MSTTIKVLAVLWTLFFAYLGIGAMRAGTSAPQGRTAEQMMRDQPNLTPAQAKAAAENEKQALAVGGACCMTLGLPVLLVVWVVGLCGLGLMFLMFRKRTATVPIEVVESPRGPRR